MGCLWGRMGARTAGRARAVEAAGSGGLTASCWRSVSQPDLTLPVLPLALLSSLLRVSRSSLTPSGQGVAEEATLLRGDPRQRHLYFVSRMNRKKRRPSTRSMRCRRPRRSARCLLPTCLPSSESLSPRHRPRAPVSTAQCSVPQLLTLGGSLLCARKRPVNTVLSKTGPGSLFSQNFYFSEQDS